MTAIERVLGRAAEQGSSISAERDYETNTINPAKQIGVDRKISLLVVG